MKNLAKQPAVKLFVTLLACSLLVYTSCKKTDIATTTGSSSDGASDDVAKQIGMNFYKALTGGYNGMNINNGINASFNVNNNHKTNSNKNPLCGLTIDTTYSNTTITGDTTFISSGAFKFTYTCSANNVDGYKLADTLNSNVSDSTYKSVNNVSQNYVVKATDLTYKKLLTNGTINTTSEYSVLKKGITKGYNNVYAQYAMVNVKVDVSSGIADAVSGKATFHMLLVNLPSNANPATDATVTGYTGVIFYLGDHQAKLSILQANGKYKSYMVNMLTGVTTPI